MLLAAGLIGCSANDLPQTVFDPKGPVAAEQLKILSLTMWLAIGVFVVVAMVFFVTIFRFRARPEQEKKPVPQVHGNTKFEIAWTFAPIVILAIIAVPTVRYYQTMSVAAAADALQIRAEGAQWWFAFEYPEEGFTTANELVIPVGRDVQLSLESRDVIHSFWVPKLAGKVDMIPGRTNTLLLRADEPGIYWGQCAEYCGTSHAKMRFRVRAVTADEYAAWVASHQNPQVTADPANALAVRGEELFLKEKVCYSCHAIDGSSAQGQVGPNLTNFGERTTLAAGVLENTPENLKAWLKNPQAVKPGAKMPNLNLSDEEIEALVAYLHGLK